MESQDSDDIVLVPSHYKKLGNQGLCSVCLDCSAGTKLCYIKQTQAEWYIKVRFQNELICHVCREFWSTNSPTNTFQEVSFNRPCIDRRMFVTDCYKQHPCHLCMEYKIHKDHVRDGSEKSYFQILRNF